jgi:hypothetical protein
MHLLYGCHAVDSTADAPLGEGGVLAPCESLQLSAVPYDRYCKKLGTLGVPQLWCYIYFCFNLEIIHDLAVGNI